MAAKRHDNAKQESSKRHLCPAKQATFYFIPHTHWEGAVFKTREEYLAIGLPHILQALKMLKDHPNYRFALDQLCYVRPFLQRYPEKEAVFQRFIKEGRLEIVGGTIVMADVNMPCGESFVRQVLYGKGYFRRKLGIDITALWQLDTFGHHAQMPQLAKLAGYKSFWFFRGVSSMDGSIPSEFLWEGIDGSRVLAFWLPYGYAHLCGSPKSPAGFGRFVRKQFEMLSPFSSRDCRAGLAGGDVYPPEEHVPALVEKFNRVPGAPFHLRLAIPSDFEKVVSERDNLPVVTGEMNPIFQGTYSSRIELKQRTRELERLLITAEKIGVLLNWLGAPVDDDILRKGWEPMLFNQAHDLMSGVMTDCVYEDTIRGYDFSRRIAEDELNGRLRDFAVSVNTRGKGIAIVVFNALNWSRTDAVSASVGFAESGVQDVEVIKPDGTKVPVQVAGAKLYPDGSLAQVEITFIAQDVPSTGYAVYRAVPVKSRKRISPRRAEKRGNCIENEFYRIRFDAGTGAIDRLVLKENGWDVLCGKGNVVAMEKDSGDFWELYRTLDGASRIAMKNRHPAPKAGQAKFSNEESGRHGTIIKGPVFSEFSVVHPFGKKGIFRTRVRVYSGIRRIEIRTHILNNEKFVRYRVLFPVSIKDGRIVHEIPFGAITRPDGIEFPAQNWIDYGDTGKGIALLNRGLPGNNVADGVMMLSLMRSECISSYSYYGGYEPGMSSGTGFALGRELAFDYALTPHKWDWRTAGIHREGAAFNHPLIAMTAASHPGVLPDRWGFLEIDNPDIMVSAMKSGSGKSVILRAYETAGRESSNVTIKLRARIVSAEEVNLMEDPVRGLSVSGSAVRLDFRPFEIKTIRFLLKEVQDARQIR